MTDVLDAGAPPSRWWRILGALAVVTLVLGLAAVAEGARRAPAERRAIDRCAEAATSAVDRAERRLALMVTYVTPALGASTPDVDAGLRRLVAAEAPAARAPVDQALGTCRGIDVWWLNAEHRGALVAYDALLVAQQERLRGVARGGGFYDDYAEVRALRAEAEQLWRVPAA